MKHFVVILERIPTSWNWRNSFLDWNWSFPFSDTFLCNKKELKLEVFQNWYVWFKHLLRNCIYFWAYKRCKQNFFPWYWQNNGFKFGFTWIKNLHSAPPVFEWKSKLLDNGSTVETTTVSRIPTSSSGKLANSSVTDQRVPVSTTPLAPVITPRPIQLMDPVDIDPPQFPLPPPHFTKLKPENRTYLG